MRRFPSLVLVTTFLSLTALSLPLHADEGSSQRTAGDAPGAHPEGPPPGIHFIPPPVMKKLNLTDDQKKQIAALEKEIKAKLDKILTPEQQKTLAESRPPRRDRQGRGGPGGDAPSNAGGGAQGGDNGPPR